MPQNFETGVTDGGAEASSKQRENTGSKQPPRKKVTSKMSGSDVTFLKIELKKN